MARDRLGLLRGRIALQHRSAKDQRFADSGSEQRDRHAASLHDEVEQAIVQDEGGCDLESAKQAPDQEAASADHQQAERLVQLTLSP
ncbi:signal transduction histidine kinase [Methylobacterium sp. R2-1]|nr:signal transduction histidine kinase [Methylobacterium sp. R2-1]